MRKWTNSKIQEIPITIKSFRDKTCFGIFIFASFWRKKITICSLFSLLMCALDAASQLWFLALFPLENARLEDHNRKIIFCLITCLLLFLRTLSVPSVSASLPVSSCGWSPKRRRGWRGKQPEMRNVLDPQWNAKEKKLRSSMKR